MSNAGFQDLLVRAPGDRSVFPHQINLVSDQILLVDLPESAQQQASFLDERALTPQTRGAWFARNAVEEAMTGAASSPAPMIFHVGHCGSTLVSRLVAAATGTNALREPLPLRALAMDKAEGAAAFLSAQARRGWIELLLKFWGRGEAKSVVKATSICTDLGADLDAETNSVFIHQAPETHLAALLAGQNAEIDLRGFAQMRHKRLAAHYNLPPLAGMDTAELAALAFAAECDAAGRAGLTAFSFDALLANPAEELRKIASALGLESDAARIEQALASDIMRTYSKAPEHKYDAGLRRQIIDQAQRNHAPAIEKGMTWLEEFKTRNGAAKVSTFLGE